MTRTETHREPEPGASHAEEPARQRPVSDDPVTVLFSRRVKPGREADFEAWAHGVTTAAHLFPGHLSASVLDVPGTREYHVLYTFADRASLDAWLDSDERRRWLARVSKMTEAERGLQAVTGLETWFKLPGSNVPTMKPPPRWKMWLVSIVAVYPLVLLFQILLAPNITSLPLALRALAYPLVLLTLMTFAVMPIRAHWDTLCKLFAYYAEEHLRSAVGSGPQQRVSDARRQVFRALTLYDSTEGVRCGIYRSGPSPFYLRTSRVPPGFFSGSAIDIGRSSTGTGGSCAKLSRRVAAQRFKRRAIPSSPSFRRRLGPSPLRSKPNEPWQTTHGPRVTPFGSAWGFTLVRRS